MAKEEVLIGFELEALSLLLHYWALSPTVKKRKANWQDKLPKFRSAVIAGMGKGIHEKLTPRELVFSEYKEIYKSLKWLRDEYNTYEAEELQPEIRISREFTYNKKQLIFERPIPVASRDVEEFCRTLLGRKKKLSEIVYEVVGERLQCSPKKVKASTLKKKVKRAQITGVQGLLISIFIDLCSLPEKDFHPDILANILNVLYETKCHVLVIYYLLQKAHAIKKDKLFVGEYDFEQVERLCSDVAVGNQLLSYKPFLRLLI